MIIKYSNGLQFLKDNREFLMKNYIENSLIILNANSMHNFDLSNYAFVVKTPNSRLVIIRKNPYNLLLSGDVSLIQEAISFMIDKNLIFEGVLCDEKLAYSFMELYVKNNGGYYVNGLSMKIMKCDIISNHLDYKNISRAENSDADDIVALLKMFYIEALGNLDEFLENKIRDDITNFYGIKLNGHFVSIGYLSKEDEYSGCISYVYTKKEMRSLGYARIVVSYLTEYYLKKNKTPYLYVDIKNPISNHLYSSIGYYYSTPRIELKYKK